MPGGGWCSGWPNSHGGAEPAPGPSFRGAGPQGEWGHAGASPGGSPERRRRRSRSRLWRREEALKWGCPEGHSRQALLLGAPAPKVPTSSDPHVQGEGPPLGDGSRRGRGRHQDTHREGLLGRVAAADGQPAREWGGLFSAPPLAGACVAAAARSPGGTSEVIKAHPCSVQGGAAAFSAWEEAASRGGPGLTSLLA